MTRSIVLRAPPAVTSRVPFVVTVDVRPVIPGQRISVLLEEKRGEGPATPAVQAEIAATSGDTAFGSFPIALRERGTVLLLATAEDESGGHFHPDGAVVEVI
ncbi:Hypothetical protein A7982_01523 [Minicystis rosea]|nr:Hypothetical protein A7982_01523 [Minicystis rosea]